MDAGRSLANSVDDRSVNGGGVMVNGGNKDDTPRLSTSFSASSINYPDNQQVFVGNLPQHLTDHDLIDFFEREFNCTSVLLDALKSDGLVTCRRRSAVRTDTECVAFGEKHLISLQFCNTGCGLVV